MKRRTHRTCTLLWILDTGTWGICVGHPRMLAGSNRPGQIGKIPFQLLIFNRSAKEYQHEQRNAMGCFSSGCFKKELLDVLRCMSCQAHDFNKSSLPMSSILFRRQAIGRLIVSNDLDLYEFRKGDLAAGFSSGGFMGPLDCVSKLTYTNDSIFGVQTDCFVGPGTTSLITCFRQLAGQGQCLFWIPTAISCQKFSG